MAKFYPARRGRGRPGGAAQPVGEESGERRSSAVARPVIWEGQIQAETAADDVGSRSAAEGQKAMDDLFKVRERFIAEEQKSLDNWYVPKRDELNDFMKSRQSVWKDLIKAHSEDPGSQAKLINAQVDEMMTLLSHRRDLQNRYAADVDALPGKFDAEISRADEYRSKFGIAGQAGELPEDVRELQAEQAMAATLGGDQFSGSMFLTEAIGMQGSTSTAFNTLREKLTDEMDDDEIDQRLTDVEKYIEETTDSKIARVLSHLQRGVDPGDDLNIPWGDQYKASAVARDRSENRRDQLEDWEKWGRSGRGSTRLDEEAVDAVQIALNEIHSRVLAEVGAVGTSGFVPPASGAQRGTESSLLDWLNSLVGEGEEGG